MNVEKLFYCLFLVLLQSTSAWSQDASPEILIVPNDWGFERIELPMEFAEGMTLTGYEELRFSPGMFDRTASGYFKYIFALSIDNKEGFGKSDITTFLNQYYKGLSKIVAESSKIEVDIDRITVKVKRAKKFGKGFKGYKAKVLFLDTFNKGEEVLLDMKFQVQDTQGQGLKMIVLVAPHPWTPAVKANMNQLQSQIIKASF